jgi:hypothetical protein
MLKTGCVNHHFAELCVHKCHSNAGHIEGDNDV